MDNALVGPQATQRGPAKAAENTLGLALSSSSTLWECLQRCWQDDVYIEAICDKFLRLTLQLLSRSGQLIILYMYTVALTIRVPNLHLYESVCQVHLIFASLTLIICKFLRYATWLSVGLAARKAGDATNIPGGEWALVSAPEDLVLVGLRYSYYFYYLIPSHNVLQETIKLDRSFQSLLVFRHIFRLIPHDRFFSALVEDLPYSFARNEFPLERGSLVWL